MSTFFIKLGKRILKDRVKPFVIAQVILLIIFIIISFNTFKDNSINFFYNGLGQITFAVIGFLYAIEHFL